MEDSKNKRDESRILRSQARVLLSIRHPTVEHGQKADLGTQVLRIGGDAAKRGRRGAKYNAVDDFLVLLGDGRDLVRSDEDDVKIRNRKNLGAVLCQPFRPELIALSASLLECGS